MALPSGEILSQVTHPVAGRARQHQTTEPMQGKEVCMYSVGPIGWWMRMWWGSQYFTPVIA